MALNGRNGKSTYVKNITTMDKYNKYWDSFNHLLYNEYINIKNQHLQEDILPDIDISEVTEMLETKSIILYNDNENTFQHVIECLMSFCQHNEIQAEQCAIIVDTKGKCSVKTGSVDQLKPIASVLLKHGLTVEIE